MRRLFLVFVVVLSGCHPNDSPIARAAGSWPGVFAIDGPKGVDRDSLKGQLELYVTGPKFQLQMQTKDQSFTVAGKWSADKGRITMTADKFDFKNPSPEDQKAFNLHIIQPEEIRAAFGHPVVLDESNDRRTLTGLRMSLGHLLGRLEFERPIPK